MTFLEVELLSIPRIVFAYSVEISKYSHSFHNYKRFLEICLHETGFSECRYADGRVITELPGMINTVTYLDDVECVSCTNEINRHTTVGVNVDYSVTKHPSEAACDVDGLKARMKEKNIILIPIFEPVHEISDKMVSIIRSIGVRFYSDDPAEKMSALSKWFALTTLLSDYVLKRLDNAGSALPPSEHMYTLKVERFIRENYARKLTLDEISDNVELSVGHLQRVFRRAKGMSIVEYVNEYRVKAAAELMATQDLSLKDAALNVGISDPAYMSRLFKKVTGMSCREYRRQKSKF